MACSGGVCDIKGPGFFKGSPAQNVQLPRYNPGQQGIMNQLLQLASQKLGNNLNAPNSQYPQPPNLKPSIESILGRFNQPFDFAPIEKQARLGFERETVPSIAERFTAMGDNALSSGAFASQIGQADASLKHSLAALKANIGREDLGRQQNLAQNLFGILANQAQQQYGMQFGKAQADEQNKLALLQNLLGIGLTPQSENIFIPSQPSGLRQLLGGLAQSIPKLIGSYFSGGSSNIAPSVSSETGGLTGLASTANYGLPNQSGSGLGQAMYPQGLGFANPNLHPNLFPGLANLNRPF